MRKRGPTAVLCADSLTAVAYTSLIFPESTERERERERKHRSTVAADGITLFEEASNSTINSAPMAQRRCKSTVTRPVNFSFKESVSDAENREKLLEALARKSGVAVSEKKPKRSGGGLPRTPHQQHHPRSMDDGFGGGAGGGVAVGPPPPPPPSSKPLF